VTSLKALSDKGFRPYKKLVTMYYYNMKGGKIKRIEHVLAYRQAGNFGGTDDH